MNPYTIGVNHHIPLTTSFNPQLLLIHPKNIYIYIHIHNSQSNQTNIISTDVVYMCVTVCPLIIIPLIKAGTINPLFI